MQHALATCSNIFYPTFASPALPMPVPLANYTGTYHDAGYGTMHLVLDCEKLPLPSDVPMQPTTDTDGCRLVLRVEQPGGDLREGGETISVMFEHLSGDFWLAWAMIDQLVEGGYRRPVWCVRAQFRLDEAGVVRWFGIDARVEGMESPLTWLERTEAVHVGGGDSGAAGFGGRVSSHGDGSRAVRRDEL